MAVSLLAHFGSFFPLIRQCAHNELSPGVLDGQRLKNILVRFHGTTVCFLGHHESHQFSMELLNLLYILGLVSFVL